MAEKMMRVGLQIRFEVMNVINKNPLKSVKLPSAQELADKFGMSRRSVTMELKKLAEEGWVIGVHGVGTFTNPERFVSGLKLPSRRIIGIGGRDARQFYHGYVLWRFQMLTGECIMPRTGYPHYVRLSSCDPELACRELKSLNLDGFIWGFPSPHIEPVLKRLHAAGVPVAVYPQRLSGVPSAEVDYDRCGREIAALLLAQGRKRIAWCAFDDPAEIRMKSAEKILAKAGVRIDPSLVFTRMNELETRLRELLEQGCPPDAVYTHGDSLYLVLALLREFGIDPFGGRCLLVAGQSVAKDIPGFRGIVRDYPYEEIARRAAELLNAQFSGNRPPVPEKSALNVRLIN